MIPEIDSQGGQTRNPADRLADFRFGGSRQKLAGAAAADDDDEIGLESHEEKGENVRPCSVCGTRSPSAAHHLAEAPELIADHPARFERPPIPGAVICARGLDHCAAQKSGEAACILHSPFSTQGSGGRRSCPHNTEVRSLIEVPSSATGRRRCERPYLSQPCPLLETYLPVVQRLKEAQHCP